MSGIERAVTAVDAVRGLLADASAHLGRAPLGEVADLLARAAELTRLVDGLQVRVAAEVVERSQQSADLALCRILGNRSAKELLSSAFGVRGRQAVDLLTVAAATTTSVGFSGAPVPARFPRVAEALAAGEVSFEQAQAIVQVLEPAEPRAHPDELAWAEGALVDAATDPDDPLVPELLTVQGRAYAALLDPDGLLPDAERQRTMRSLNLWQRRDGTWKTVIISPPEDGSAMKALLDAYTGPRVKVAFRDNDETAADAGDAEVSVEDRTPAQVRHDVFVGMVRAHAASGDAPTVGGEAPVLVFAGTIDAYAAYLAGTAHRQPCLRIEHTGDLVPMERVAALICDGQVQVAVHASDTDQHVLQLGRSQRLFSRAQRRALALRDQGCRAPGCLMPPAWCEAHHIQPWQAGGLTDIENGILLCTYHHHEVHAGRLVIEPAGPGPGQWRVVSQLQPLRRRTSAASTSAMPTLEFAATTTAKTTDPAAGGAAPASLAAATPALAVRLPDRHRARRTTPQRTRPAARGPAPTKPSTLEQRLRQRLPERRDRATRHARIDLRPPPQIILRT